MLIMEDPVVEIRHVVHLLTQSTPSVQQRTIERYYTPSASFIHPFCRTGSFSGSRWLIIWIYRFYKIMSPHIDLKVESVAFDAENLLLYVTISQVFRIFFIPFYVAPVTLTTVLTLTTSRSSHDNQHRDRDTLLSATTANSDRDNDDTLSHLQPGSVAASDPGQGSPELSSQTLYYISVQNDLYQTSEFIKFILPFGIGSILVFLWHSLATFISVGCALILWPSTFVEEPRL
uniref:SigF-like NTF2-like domain-containing protein n=1 Tax=Coccidioides posadasii RMSCC 3488 TaxID=454284 RepID=A0A0J6F3Z7_COCPO|nr:hypothetical protein CPAG_00033 [Coccidioides posadasii RMSCC 3488]